MMGGGSHADGDRRVHAGVPGDHGARRLSSDDVLQVLADLLVERGSHEHTCSDNGPELMAQELGGWLGWVGVTTLFIEPASPSENACHDPFNGKRRDELLD